MSQKNIDTKAPQKATTPTAGAAAPDAVSMDKASKKETTPRKKRSNIVSHFLESLPDWNYIFKEELRTIFKDQGVLIFCLLLPLGYPILYTWIYNNEVCNDVPTVVVDDSQTAFSREYIRKVDATPEIRIVSYAADMNEARKAVKQRDAYGIIYIPSTFSQDISRMQQTRVSLFADMSGMLYYKAVLLANTNVSLAMNARIKVERAGKTTAQEEALTTHPITYEQVELYNPTNGMASYLIPAVLVLIIQQSLVLSIGLAAGTRREKNAYRTLTPINRHYHGLMRIVMGQSLAYILIYLWNITYVLFLVPKMFSLPQIGSVADIWMIMTPFLIAVTFFGMTLSVLIRQREACFMIIVFTSVPLLFLSGISWPTCAMPDFWRYVSYLFPSTFGVKAYVAINNTGATLNEVKTEWYALWIQAVAYFLTTLVVYRRNIIISRLKFIEKYRNLRKRKTTDKKVARA